MKHLLHRLFIKNWPRKCVAFFGAIVIWFLVNQTITVTRTFSDVAIRVINLPSDKTVVGLLPNGLLSKRITLTITGMKSDISDLTSNDLEILINAEGQKESWIASISKKNLVHLSSEKDLKKSITSLSAPEILIKLSKLVTEEIPVTIMKPIGDPPQGYQLLDVWPQELVQKVSGPQEQVQALKERGLEVTLNLNRISKHELDALSEAQKLVGSDEIGFKVPAAWKQVSIPFHDYALEPLNDPRAQFMRIDFLKQEFIPLGLELPISIFFPLKYSRTLNPETYTLATGLYVSKKNGLKLFTVPLYAHDVSRLFLDVVKDNMELTLIASPRSVQEYLDWTITFYDLDDLEQKYVEASLQETKNQYERELQSLANEQFLRSRFREYVSRFVLYSAENRPLSLRATLDASTITIQMGHEKSRSP